VLPDLETYGQSLSVEINNTLGPTEQIRLSRIEVRAVKSSSHNGVSDDVFIMHQDDIQRNGYIHAVVTVQGNGTLTSPLAAVGSPINQYNMRRAALPVARVSEGVPFILSTLGRRISGITPPWHTSPPVDIGDSRIVVLFQFLPK
jgi:hypothetical protein